jgi:hypothetical protein
VSLAPAFNSNLVNAIVRLSSEQTAVAREQAARKTAEVARLTEKLERLIDLRMRELVSDVEYLPMRAKIHKELTIAQAERHSAPEVVLTETDALRLVSSLSDLKGTWRVLGMEQKTVFGKLLLPVGYEVGRIRTAELGLLFRVSGSLTGGDPNVVPLIRAKSNTLFAEIRSFLAVVSWLTEAESQAA